MTPIFATAGEPEPPEEEFAAGSFGEPENEPEDETEDGTGDEPLPPDVPLEAPGRVDDEEEDEDFRITEVADEYTLGAGASLRPRPKKDSPRAARKPAASRRAGGRARGHAVTQHEVGKVRTILLFLFLTVLAYGALTATLLQSAETSERFARSLPILGKSVGADRLMYRKVVLADVTGNYRTIRDGEKVFVITGRVLNTAPVPLQNIRIAGKLFGSPGAELGSCEVYWGNVISEKVLRDLTRRELKILQQVSPPKHFPIEPGDSAPFMIVFLEPPEGAAEFSAQVTSAQRQA